MLYHHCMSALNFMKWLRNLFLLGRMIIVTMNIGIKVVLDQALLSSMACHWQPSCSLCMKTVSLCDIHRTACFATLYYHIRDRAQSWRCPQVILSHGAGHTSAGRFGASSNPPTVFYYSLVYTCGAQSRVYHGQHMPVIDRLFDLKLVLSIERSWSNGPAECDACTLRIKPPECITACPRVRCTIIF